MKENARQGFWNGALPPIGYRIIDAVEQRGHRTKKTLEIDPIQAAATTSVRWPSGWKWTRKRFASWDRKACSCARSSPLPA